MSSFPPAGGIGQGGGSLNVPDDHRFATTDARDAAIPSPKDGEQCTIQSNVPQYHLLQEYRSGAWVDITYIITGPKGDKGEPGAAGGGLVQVGKDGSFTEVEFIEIGENLNVTIDGEGGTGKATISAGSSVNPSEGFALNKDTAISTRLPDGTPVDFVRAPGLVENLLIGNESQGMDLITLGDGVYVKHDGGKGRVILDDEGVKGLKLNPLTDSKYFNLQDAAWSSVIDDHAVGDIAYFVQTGTGELFTGLPSSIELQPSVSYIVASEVSSGNGFAHRLSIVSTSIDPDDANNRTVQRAGSDFEHAKDRWAEVMLKRDAVIYSDMTVGSDSTFQVITAGNNMSGEVVDGILTLSAAQIDEYDTIHARMLQIHQESPDSNVFSELTVDGNKNTIIRSIGDTHFYQKNKDTGELTEAFQIDSSGRFVAKQKVKTPIITNLGSGTTNSNSDKAGFIDLSVENEVKLGAKSKVSFSVSGASVVQVSSDAVKVAKPIDLSNQNLTKVKHITGNSTGSMNVAGVHVIKRDDSSDTSQSIHFNSGDITSYSDKHEWKTNDNARRLTIENHTADWHDCEHKNAAEATTDKGLPNLLQVKNLIAEAGEGDSFKKVKLDVGGSPTYYEHNGDSHLYIEYSGNGGTVSIDTMRSGSEQQSDIVLMHNTMSTNAFLRLFFNGSSDLIELPGYSYVVGWANRDIGRWVTMTSKSAMSVPDERVVLADELAWTATDDPRENTKRIIAAAPEHCTIIGYHNKDNSNKKYHVVSQADTDKNENTRSTFVIHKKADGHATGMSTTEGSSGDKVWSRILDGARGAWDTSDTTSSFGLAEDVPLYKMPEGQMVLTGDQGIMQTVVGTDGQIELEAIQGYNIQQMIEEALHPKTRSFVNEPMITIDYPDDVRGNQYRPNNVVIMVLKTDSLVNGLNISVVGGDYDGNYNAIGPVYRDEHGEWAQGGKRNAYRINTGEDKYCVFDVSLSFWIFITADVDHNHTGQQTGGTPINLYNDGQLPDSYGSYTITNTLDEIDSEYFTQADVSIEYHTNSDANSYFTVNFGTAKPAGIVFYK